MIEDVSNSNHHKYMFITSQKVGGVLGGEEGCGGEKNKSNKIAIAVTNMYIGVRMYFCMNDRIPP